MTLMNTIWEQQHLYVCTLCWIQAHGFFKPKVNASISRYLTVTTATSTSAFLDIEETNMTVVTESKCRLVLTAQLL